LKKRYCRLEARINQFAHLSRSRAETLAMSNVARRIVTRLLAECDAAHIVGDEIV
jgi:hypothetical protein